MEIVVFLIFIQRFEKIIHYSQDVLKWPDLKVILLRRWLETTIGHYSRCAAVFIEGCKHQQQQQQYAAENVLSPGEDCNAPKMVWRNVAWVQVRFCLFSVFLLYVMFSAD